jgi:hypothetical protein
MTTITIERELLVRIEKELFLARNYGGTLRDEPLLKKVSAVLALASEFDSIIEAIGDDPAPSTAPAWHDAPTVPGVWICDEGDICYTWTAHNIEILDQFDPGDGLRWYGPIPPDGDKP